MTPPVPEPQPRPAWRDPRLRLSVVHILEAAYLVTKGWPLLHIIRRGEGKVVFQFAEKAERDLAEIRRAADELAAQRERTFRAPSPSIPRGQQDHGSEQQ